MNYYRAGPPGSALLVATIIGSLLLSLFFFVSWLCLQSRLTLALRKLVYCAFLLVLIYPLESVREYLNTEAQHYDLRINIGMLTTELSLAVGIALVVAGNLWIFRAARRIVLLLLLMVPSLALDFTWARLNAQSKSAYEAKPRAPVLMPHGNGRHVVWLLFDEFDERLAFELHRPNVPLPELNRLRSESFWATHAIQTATWTTVAVPSLLSGQIFGRAEPADAATLRVYPKRSAIGGSWTEQQNIFKRLRAEGFNSALIGWHHPYCRVIGGDLCSCTDVPSGEATAALLRETSATEMGVFRSIPFLFYLQFTNLVDIFRPGPPQSAYERDAYSQKRQQEQYFEIRDLAYRAAVDHNFDLLFLHFPIPHPFGIYDARRHELTLNGSLSYADNLALVDRTIGELRRTMDTAGMWDSSTLIITSDHGLRPDLWRGRLGWTAELDQLTGGMQEPRVPFIVKLAGKNSEVRYDRPFSTVSESDIIFAILNGKIVSPSDLARWLDSRGATASKFMR